MRTIRTLINGESLESSILSSLRLRRTVSADYDCVKTTNERCCTTFIVGRTSKREYSRCFPLNEHIVLNETMLFFGVLSICLALASAEYCYSDVEGACSTRPTETEGSLIPNCNAKYGAVDALQADLQSYVNANIESSFEFLLMSTHFGNYEAQREGFKHLYRKYSDKTWEDAIDLIKYITQRGGRMNFNQLPRFKKAVKETRVLELNEINSLARALDTQKQLAEEAMRIHAQAQPHSKHDAAVAHYIEEKFLESHSERVRELAGHTSDLKNLLTERDPSLSVFLFDEFLQKAL